MPFVVHWSWLCPSWFTVADYALCASLTLAMPFVLHWRWLYPSCFTDAGYTLRVSLTLAIPFVFHWRWLYPSWFTEADYALRGSLKLAMPFVLHWSWLCPSCFTEAGYALRASLTLAKQAERKPIFSSRTCLWNYRVDLVYITVHGLYNSIMVYRTVSRFMSITVSCHVLGRIPFNATVRVGYRSLLRFMSSTA